MKNYIAKLLLFLVLMLSFSCEDYLDIAPESELDQIDVFSNFDSAQGFVEEMYGLIVDYGTSAHTFQDYLYGDDGYGNRTWKGSYLIDNGNLTGLNKTSYSYLTSWKNSTYGTSNASTTQNNQSRRPGVWDGSLKGIRNANIVLESADLMIGLSQEETNIILGQAYFFRAFFHNEIMKFWGRFPYIDRVFVGDFDVPRPETYKECALAANEDYKKAIELLPVNWDDRSFGQKTFGDNMGRLTKGTAYAFQGKNLLLAASPLMHGNNGSMNTYEYDTELANMAVDAFVGILKLTDQGRYRLASNLEEYEEVFWKTPASNMWPGSTEFILGPTSGNATQAQRFMTSGMDRDIHGQGGSEISSPTHNFIHNNFGMSNGLSIEDDMSGNYGPTLYDPNKPFENRDPRFYKWIVVDGDSFGSKEPPAWLAKHNIAKLYTGGEHRSTGSDNQPSTTGYMRKKFYPVEDGQFHSKWNRIIQKYKGTLLQMRLTDVYLMYAEALHAAKGATTAPSSYSLTAVNAINLLRSRAGIPDVNSSIVSNNNKFMDELRRERSVELSFEAHRWLDLRRWGVAHLEKYKRKLAYEFPQDHSSFTERLLVERICEYPKHYWIPFDAKQTQIYEGFPQNPGW